MSRFGLDFDYRRGSEDYNARLRKLVPELQTAAAKAVNETADEILRGLVPVIEESFENPTDFTLDAMAATKARAGRSPSALVYMKEEQYSYLRYHLEGGHADGRRKIRRHDRGRRDRAGQRRRSRRRRQLPRRIPQMVEATGGWWMTTRGGDAGLFRRTPYGKVEAIAIATDRVVYKRRLVIDQPLEEIVEEVLPERLAEAMAKVFGE